MAGISLQQVFIDTFIKRLPRDIGNASLDKARSTCPIQTGELYRSLYVTIKNDSFELGATVPYASDVEEGTQAVMIAGSWTGKWDRFKRTSTKGIKHTVRGHTKTFKGKKPVETSGTTNKATQEWSTRSATSGREGTFFMKKAVQNSMKEQMEKILLSMGATKT